MECLGLGFEGGGDTIVTPSASAVGLDTEELAVDTSCGASDGYAASDCVTVECG